MARIVEPTPQEIGEAVERLRGGGPVAFPTETVYGLGADTFNVNAIRAVFALKRRREGNPLSAHVPDDGMARRLVSRWDERCDRLIARFWPGPLTLVLAKADDVPDASTAGLATIALRCPRHVVARRLLERFGTPVSATSANRSGRLSPTSASHVAGEFPDAEDLPILDGGACEVGLESTVLDLTRHRPRVLRPGAVTPAELREVLDDLAEGDSGRAAPRRAALATPAELVDAEHLRVRLRELQDPAAVLCFDAADAPPPHRAIVMPTNAAEYARRMYDALHEAEAMELGRIVIEQPPMTVDLWPVIVNRLKCAVRR